MTIRHIIVYKGMLCSLALIQKEYGPAYLEVVNQRDAIEGTLQGPPYFPSDFDDFVENLKKSKGKDEVFAILLHEKSGDEIYYRYIGHTGIHGMRWPDGRGTTGSLIIDVGLQGKGVGTEAKLLLLYHCFIVRNLRKVQSNVKAWNAKSLGHLIKTGYRMWGRSRANIAHNGEFVDEIFLEVFPQDWRPIWDQYKLTGELPKLTDEQRALVKKETNT